MCDSACMWFIVEDANFEVILNILKIFRGSEIQNLDWSMQMSFHQSRNRIS